MEIPISMNMVGRSGVMVIKAMETGKGGGCSSQHETMDVARSEPQGRAVTMRTLFTWQSGIDLLLMAFGVSRHLLGFRQIFCIPRWTAQPGIFYQECESQGAMRVCKLKRFLL